jgi:hypothetical protein
MREIANWAALLVIAVVALSPVFEVFDKTDGLAQDTTDLLRYVLCLFCFLAFSLRKTIFTFGLTLLRRWIVGPLQRSRGDVKISTASFPRPNDRGLFLTFHDLRI